MALDTFIICFALPYWAIGVGAPILLLVGRLFQGFSEVGDRPGRGVHPQTSGRDRGIPQREGGDGRGEALTDPRALPAIPEAARRRRAHGRLVDRECLRTRHLRTHVPRLSTTVPQMFEPKFGVQLFALIAALQMSWQDLLKNRYRVGAVPGGNSQSVARWRG